MTFSVHAPREFFQAALLCVSKDASRPNLHGVFLDPRGYVVATSGHMLFVGEAPACRSLPHSVLIPTDAVAAALKKSPRARDMYCVSDPAGVFRLAGDVLFEPSSAQFPEAWPRVIPGKIQDIAPAHFDGEYYRNVSKMAKILTGGRYGFTIAQQPNGPCGVAFDRTDCCAVIMPVRREEECEWPVLTINA